MAAGIWAWFGSCVPRFSHRRSLQFTFLHVFAQRPVIIFSIWSSRQSQTNRDGAFATSPSHIFWTRGSQRVRASPDIQNATSKIQMCLVSANATQLLLSAGIRQPTRRLCTRIGCWSRAPVGFHQSEAMKDCALTADRMARTRLLRFKWLGSEKQNQKTSCVAVSCPRQPSLLFRGLLPLLIYVPLLLSSRVIRIAFSAQNFCKSRRPNLNANSPRHSLPGLGKSSRDGRRTVSHRRKPS